MKQPIQTKPGEGILPPYFVLIAVIVVHLFAAERAACDEIITYEIPKTSESTRVVLTIEQAINICLEANRGIATTIYSAESQKYSIAAARSDFDLKLIPTATVDVEGGNNSENKNASAGIMLKKRLEAGTTLSVGPRINRYDQQYMTDVGVTIEQPLLRGLGRDFNTDTILNAEFIYQTAVRNIYQTKVNTVLDAVAAFYDAIKQMKTAKIHDAMKARLKGHSEVARAKEKVGLATPMDTYRAEILLKETEDAAIQTYQAYEDANDRIKLILSLPQKTEFEFIVPEAPTLMELELKDAIDIALENRIELEQMRSEMSEAERKTAVLKHNIMPDLNVVVGYGRYSSSDTAAHSLDLDQSRWKVFLQSTADISRTAEKSAYQQSLLRIEMLRLNMEEKSENIKRETRKQWLALKQAEQRMGIRKAQIHQSEEKLALAEVKFAHDMANNFDVIEAENELLNAKVNLLSAEIEYALGVYNMKAILGILVPRT